MSTLNGIFRSSGIPTLRTHGRVAETSIASSTLADFDFRADTNTPTETINDRQAVHPDSAMETESGGATPSYHGGYVFEYENDPAETAIADGDDNSSDAAAQDIITTMSDQYELENDKVADMGSYCVDIKRRRPARSVTVVTCGMTMIEAQH